MPENDPIMTAIWNEIRIFRHAISRQHGIVQRAILRLKEEEDFLIEMSDRIDDIISRMPLKQPEPREILHE